jgi:hypothetical protein
MDGEDAIVPRPDGPDGVEIAGMAILFQRLASDQHALLENVSRGLAAVLPAAVRVKRRGLFNSGKARSAEIALGDKVYELREERGQVTAHIGHSVGGVVLSHEPVAIDVWIARLRDALEQAAASSEAVRAALARLA